MAFQQPTSFSISAVLPAYNEAAIIERTVRHVASVLGGLATDFEVIVTNDGSRDATGEILADLQAHEPDLHLRVVTHERNRGYGAALASGFDAARKDLIFLTDGDKQFDVTELSGFIPAMDSQTDMVIGWRKKRADPLMRKLNALGWKTLVNGLFGYTARDVDCAFKLFRRRGWEGLPVPPRGGTVAAGGDRARLRRAVPSVAKSGARAGGRSAGANSNGSARRRRGLTRPNLQVLPPNDPNE